MTFVPINDANDVPRNVDVFSRTEGADTVLTQALALVNPVTGDPVLPHADGSMPVSQTSPTFWRVGFAEVGAGLQGLAASELTLVKTGAGMTVNQSGGNLLITTGTTVNAETVIRSNLTFRGALLSRYKAILSQRIANQIFRFELADLIGSDLAYNINSATSVTVTFPSTNPFTSANVGQSMRLAALSSVGIPGRFAIASVSGLTVTFTVAGWPASGSGTLMLYGHNYLQAEYSGTTATNLSFDAQRRGWASGNTNVAINTTASPGHVAQMTTDVLTAGCVDALVASNTGYQFAGRGSRIENIPDEDVILHFFVVVQNGSTAPASTTTLTIGFLSVEDQPRNKVRISGADPANNNPLPVQVLNPVSSVSITGNPVLGAGANVIGNTGMQIPLLVADIASAALTTTTTTAAITPAMGAAYQVNIPVTAVTGTNPTLDVVIQESDDAGTNWTDVFHFPRIIATGLYRSPMLALMGNRIRYVQTVGGSGPSFTRSLNRLQRTDSIKAVRQIINRAIDVNTLNSTIAAPLQTINADNHQLVVQMGAIVTTAPAFQIEGSDDNGASWYAIGTPLTAVASSTVELTVNGVHAQRTRVRVSTAGVGATLNHLVLKSF